jgi:hypothetical protein
MVAISATLRRRGRRSARLLRSGVLTEQRRRLGTVFELLRLDPSLQVANRCDQATADLEECRPCPLLRHHRTVFTGTRRRAATSGRVRRSSLLSKTGTVVSISFSSSNWLVAVRGNSEEFSTDRAGVRTHRPGAAVSCVGASSGRRGAPRPDRWSSRWWLCRRAVFGTAIEPCGRMSALLPYRSMSPAARMAAYAGPRSAQSRLKTSTQCARANSRLSATI